MVRFHRGKFLSAGVAALAAILPMLAGPAYAGRLTLSQELLDFGGPGDAAGVRTVVDGACRAAQRAGGTMEYCHGVGWKLAHLMEREHGGTGLDVLRRVKAALDPAGILNPGKGGL